MASGRFLDRGRVALRVVAHHERRGGAGPRAVACDGRRRRAAPRSAATASLVWSEQRIPSGCRGAARRHGAVLHGAARLAAAGRPAADRARRRRACCWACSVSCGSSARTRVMGGGRADLLGAAAVVFGSFSWAFGSIYSRHAPTPASPFLSTAMQMLAASVALLAVSVVARRAVAVRLRRRVAALAARFSLSHRVRLDRRVQRLHLAAARQHAGARQHVCLRESRRGGAARLPRSRAKR